MDSAGVACCGAVVWAKSMIAKRCFGYLLAAWFFGAIAGLGAELPAQSKKPTKDEHGKACDIGGAPGVMAANGVCVRLSGYISSQFSAGQLNRQLK
jgi:hypothetical protein